ncbi:DUF2769 domain-containing protein [Acidobacteriota bacterium]
MGRVPNTEENMEKCICDDCPSYNQCMKDKDEGFYCAEDKSTCEFDKNGCLCGMCPLTAEFALEKMYYCETGAEE